MQYVKYNAAPNPHKKMILKRAAFGHSPRKRLHAYLLKFEEAASFQDNAYNVFTTYLKFMLNLSATLI